MPDSICYLIAHTPRTGSNWLCEVLANTGQAGIGHVNRAGLFVGYGDHLSKPDVWPGKVDEYFAGSTTSNGVCGMKSDWDYLDRLADHFPDGAFETLMARYTHHILLTRSDVVAQAVSLWIAAWSGVYTSVNAHQPHKKDPLQAPYSFKDIVKRIDRIKMETRRWRTWYAQQGITALELVYEDMAAPGEMVKTAQRIFEFLGLKPPAQIETALTLRPQTNPLKASYAARFRQEWGEQEPSLV